MFIWINVIICGNVEQIPNTTRTEIISGARLNLDLRLDRCNEGSGTNVCISGV